MGPPALLVALFALAPGESSARASVPAQPSPGRDAAEPARLRLSWSAPPSCPPAEDARDLVESLTGARVVQDGSHDAEADVQIEPSGARFVGRVKGRGPDGDHARELAADDCGVLSRALALVVAVRLDAVAVASRAEVQSEQAAADPTIADVAGQAGAVAPTTEAAPAPARERTPVAETDTTRSTDVVETGEAAPRPRARLPPRLELGGRVALGVGGLVLPSAGLGVQAGPYIGTRHVHVHVVAEYWTARTIDLPGDRSASAQLRLATGGVRGCGVLGRGRVRVPLCAGVDAGAVLASGSGSGLVRQTDARAPWAAVIVQPGVAFEVARWLSLWVAFEGAISLHRPRFRFEGMPEGQDLFTVGAFGPRGFVGLQLHAPRRS